MCLDEFAAESPWLFNGLDLDIGASLDRISSVTVLRVHHDLQHYSKQDLFFSVKELEDVSVRSLSLLHVAEKLHKSGALACKILHRSGNFVELGVPGESRANFLANLLYSIDLWCFLLLVYTFFLLLLGNIHLCSRTFQYLILLLKLSPELVCLNHVASISITIIRSLQTFLYLRLS